MNFFKVTSVDKTKEIIKENINNFRETETISLIDSQGRILSKDIYSNEDVPAFNKSTVDGYSVKSSNVNGASETIPVILNGLEEVVMGKEYSNELLDGYCIYTPTGGMVPLGADGVVMIEYSQKLGNETFIERGVAPGENIIYKGEDIKSGDLLVPKNANLTPEKIGSLAAAGKINIEVYKKLNFSIISTGDEIISNDEDISKGQVRDINTYTLASAIKSFGGHIESLSVARDTLKEITDSIANALKLSDIVILSGGSSVGTKDFTIKAIEKLGGNVLVHGISLKPGKPTILATINNKLVVGLPGHPVSALIVFRALFEEILTMRKPTSTKLAIGKNVHSTPGRTTYQAVSIEGETVLPIYGKSGVISLLSKADGYIVIPSYIEGISSGEVVEVFKF